MVQGSTQCSGFYTADLTRFAHGAFSAKSYQCELAQIRMNLGIVQTSAVENSRSEHVQLE
jgi:hypothetical protein